MRTRNELLGRAYLYGQSKSEDEANIYCATGTYLLVTSLLDHTELMFLWYTV